MKHLFTLLLALVAFAIGTPANGWTPVSYVGATSSNLNTTLCVGDPVTNKPTFKVTSGSSSYYFLEFDSSSGRWEKKVNGVWQTVSSGNFTEGTWRFSCMVWLSNNSAYDERYAFTENIKVEVNGTSWATDEFSASEGSSRVRVYSPGMTALRKISEVVGTSSNLTTIPDAGKSVTTKPTINITQGSPTTFEDGCWQVQENGDWINVTNGVFYGGNWRYAGTIKIPSSSTGSYCLASDVVLKINGMAWNKANTNSSDNTFEAKVYSPVIAITVDPRTKISTVEGTSTNLTQIPVIGESVTNDPTITVTKGAPAYFTASGSNGYWQQKVNGEWKSVTSGNFTSGTWRYACQVRIDSSVDPNNQYVLTDNVSVKVNGSTWTKGNISINDTYSYVLVYSPEMTAKAADPRTKISLVEATSYDLFNIPEGGVSVKTKPTIKVTKGAPAYFSVNSANGWWQQKVNGQWQDVKDGNFVAGTEYRFGCQVRIDSSTDPNNRYVLDNNVKVKVEGVTWTNGTLYNNESATFSYIFVYSYAITARAADSRTKVSSVVGTSSDLTTIPVVGESVRTKPTITVTTGSPARFAIDGSNGDWEKLVNGQWQIVTSGNFTAYDSCRFTCQVRIDSKTDPNNQYVLAPSVKVKVNGTEWERGRVTIGSTYSLVQVYSPAMLPEQPQIHAVHALLDSPLSSYAWVGKSVTDKPEFEVLIGSPAYFTNSVWEKKVSGQWQAVQSGSFTAGTWRLHTYVKLNNTESGYFADDIKVKVDGVEWQRGSYYTSTMLDIYSPEVTAKTGTRSGTLGSKGSWQFADGVLTVTYNGQMPQNCTKETTDPEVAYRLKWIDFLSEIEEVVVKGQDVEIQPYFLYYESTSTTDGNHPDDLIRRVTLGSGVKSIGKSAFSLYSLQHVYCYRLTPPTITTTNAAVFWNKRLTANNAWLHLVPDASTSYDNNTPWSNFSPRILRDLSAANDPDYTLPAGIRLDKTYLEFDGLEQTYRLTATVLPSNASDKTVKWTTSNMSAATVSSSGMVRAVGSGTATITATTVNGLTATCEVKVSIARNGTLGTQGVWDFADGVLTVDYQGAMPTITKSTTDPDKAFRLQWEEFLGEIEEVVVKGNDVEIQPYFLYFEGDGPDGSHPDDHIRRVTLSSGVKFIGDRALSMYSLSELLCYSEEPPVLASDLSSSSKCFWKARLQANDAWLYTLPYAAVNYSFAGGEWSYFNLMGDLYLEEDPVGVNEIQNSKFKIQNDGSWYTLDGQKLDGKPSKPGLYIVNGKKVVIK